MCNTHKPINQNLGLLNLLNLVLKLSYPFVNFVPEFLSTELRIAKGSQCYDVAIDSPRSSVPMQHM